MQELKIVGIDMLFVKHIQICNAEISISPPYKNDLRTKTTPVPKAHSRSSSHDND